MTPEQKQRAMQMLRRFSQTTPMTRTADNAAVAMAALLEELINAPEAEPVAYATGYYAGCLSIATIDGRVLHAGTALYLAPPAPSVPDGWKLVPVEPTPEPFGYFKAEPFGWTDCAETDDGAIALYTAPPAPSVPDMRLTGQWESSRIADYNRGWNECRQAMLSAAPTPAEAPADVARLDWLVASNWYVGPEYDADEAGGIVGYDNKNIDGLRTAIDAAMSEKGGA